jgi:hypothetical protein
MTHEILERVYRLILRGEFISKIELSLNHYKQLKIDLEVEDDITEYVGLRIVITQTQSIHVR